MNDQDHDPSQDATDPPAALPPAAGESAATDKPRRRRKPRSAAAEGQDAERPPREARPPRPPREPREAKTPREVPGVAQAREGAQQWFTEVVSGAFDVQAEAAVEALTGDDAPLPIETEVAGSGELLHEGLQAASPEDAADDGVHKRVLAPDADAPKLHKVLAQAGVGSRRDLEAMIESGRVTVNNEPAHTGQRISHGDHIRVDGKPVRVRIHAGKPRVLAYHKPAGEVVTHDDPQQRPTVFRRLPRLPHGKWQSVGRLDLNTEGLLLFTNSGELANQLMHPRFGVEREYAVRVLGRLGEESKERLLTGVDIEGQAAAFLSIDDGGGEGVNHWYRVVLNEGRHREVRRLFEAVGLTVSRLIRIRYGCVVLPRGLKRGGWVDLSEHDVNQLSGLVGLQRERRGAGKGARGGQAGHEGRGPKGGKGRDARDAGPRAQAPRGDRAAREPREPKEGRRERFENGPIPNPLLQTYDKRAFKEAQRRPRQEAGEDGPIPNPLQQTFDQRALKEERRKPRKEYGDDGPIPNPLVQTYDKRAAQLGRREQDAYRDDRDDRDDHGPIPNPLQQTFDRRFVSGNGKPGAGRGGRPQGRAEGGGRPADRSGGKGGGSPGRGAGKPASRGAKGGARPQGGQPDPMRTAVGYIGADAALNRGGGKNRRGGRGR